MPRQPPVALKKFLKPYDNEVQKLALNLRALVLEELAPCYENIYDAYSAVAIGYGWSDRLGDGILHIAVYTKGANLGFNDGAKVEIVSGLMSTDQTVLLGKRTLTDGQTVDATEAK